MSKIDGVASRDWAGVRGHHCEVGQRTGVDKFDRVMEHDESDDKRIENRANQSVQGMIRTIRSDIEGRRRVTIDAGFLLTRFEVGRGGKTANG